MAPFCKLSDLQESPLDPIDKEDEAELEMYDPAELAAVTQAIDNVLESCSNSLLIVDTCDSFFIFLGLMLQLPLILCSRLHCHVL